jgi:alpha-glucosidase
MAAIDRAHHDGSALYVDNQAPRLGDRVNVRARVPANAGVRQVFVRALVDGEPHFVQAAADEASSAERWWRAEVAVANPVTAYRFLLRLEGGGYRWLNGTGVHRHELTDDEDFRLVTFDPPPSWTTGAVVYQVFLDRFAASGARRALPAWAARGDWYESAVAHEGGRAGSQLFGGDLAGVEAHLDHVQHLGANVIYLTPFFPAPSNHRYDAETFGTVDPLLGGDDALVSLSQAAHKRGLRLLGDLTTNHTGSGHEWFRAAQADPSATEREFYYWQAGQPGYACWLGVPQLPKLNYASTALWERLITGPDAAAARWLKPPYDLDGWRVDVANMTGRHGADDFNAAVAKAMRAAMAAAKPETFLVAEHGHDYTTELRGDGWHGAMNYAGFTKPAWSFLARPGNDLQFLGLPVEVPRSTGKDVFGTMSRFLARVPWRVANNQLNLLGSHDTPRIRTVLGDRAALVVGAALLFTFPGIPMVFAGDEIGIEGRNGEDARKPFPWERPQSWDRATLIAYRDLVALRRSSAALRSGGMRWVYQGDDAVAYLREAPGERMLVLLTRAPGKDLALDARSMGWSGEAVNRFGGAALRAHNGKVAVPGEGPMAQIWQLA